MPDEPTPTKVSAIPLTADSLVTTDKFVGNKLVDGVPKTHLFPYSLFKAVTDALSTALSTLTSAVAGKAPISHTHTPAEAGLSNVPNVDARARSTHTGTQAQSTIIDLVSDLAGKAATKLSINAQTGTSYTLVIGDDGKLVTLSNATAIALTVPPNGDVAFEVGTQILLRQSGAGQVTVGPGSGVTLQSHGAKLKLTGQHAGCTLIKEATNTWSVQGNLTT